MAAERIRPPAPVHCDRSATFAAFVLFAGALAAAPLHAGVYDVPSVSFPTLQSAIDDAAVKQNPSNVIRINAELSITNTIDIGSGFGPAVQLVIRPGPALARARILSTNDGADSLASIVRIHGAQWVMLQSLDVLRNAVNGQHLVIVENSRNITIERCRIGSLGGAADQLHPKNAIDVLNPSRVIVRNTVCFSRQAGGVAIGIHAVASGDPTHSLLLYNDVVSDYSAAGIDLAFATAGSYVVLRNNIACNFPDFPPPNEPFAWRSAIATGVTVVTSHNTSLADAGFEENMTGVKAIARSSPGDATYVLRPTSEIDTAFLNRSWNLTPGFTNPDFFRLQNLGTLHTPSTRWGITVGNGAPDTHDAIVRDDGEKDPRPGGTTLHTDRGIDQIEPGAPIVAVGNGPAMLQALELAPQGNPARTASLQYVAQRSGSLELTLVDASGRVVQREHLSVATGERGTWRIGRLAPGVYLYRGTLVSGQGERSTVTGRLAVFD